MVNMATGEVTPGGVGFGLMGMLVNILLAVFIAGLMVGRTPEYLGKKVQAPEIKLLMLSTLTIPLWSRLGGGVGGATTLVDRMNNAGPQASPSSCTSSRRPGGTTARRFPYTARARWYTTTRACPC